MLHGQLQINHRTIGTWQAQRIVTRESGRHTYRWEVHHRDVRLIGELTHRYDDGALVLASKVLAAASSALAAKLPQTPTADATRAAETRSHHTEPEGER